MKKHTKRWLLLLFLGFAFATMGYSQCCQKPDPARYFNENDDYVCIKIFNAKLKKAKEGKKAPVSYFSVILNKGNDYVFIMTDPPGFGGRSMFNLIHNKKNVVSSYINGKDYKRIEFTCSSTGKYYFAISFKEEYKNKKGCAWFFLGMKKPL